MSKEIKRLPGGAVTPEWAAEYLKEHMEALKENGGLAAVIDGLQTIIDSFRQVDIRTSKKVTTPDEQHVKDHILHTFVNSIGFVEDLYAIECVKAGYLANGGNEDDFYAMEAGEWTECFKLWFEAFKEKHSNDKQVIMQPPVNVGDMIYKVWSCGRSGKSVAEFKVTGIHNRGEGWYVMYQGKNNMYNAKFEDFGATVFTTREAVERKIKEMK